MAIPDDIDTTDSWTSGTTRTRINRISLYVRYTDIVSGEAGTHYQPKRDGAHGKEYGMKELELKYGCNPNRSLRIYMEDGSNCLSGCCAVARIHQFSGCLQCVAAGKES